MTATCPNCGSSDLWRPWLKGRVDALLAMLGHARFQCRKCRKTVYLRVKPARRD